MPDGKPVPAHLFGNMWAQQWNNIYDLLEPYPGVSNLDVTTELVKQGYDAVDDAFRGDLLHIARFQGVAADFLGTLDADAPAGSRGDCYASAWNMDAKGDLRIKMCISVNEEDLYTLYHELGHVYYDLSYMQQPYLYQTARTTASTRRSATRSTCR